MSSIRNLRFLLDENVSHNLILVLKTSSVDWRSLKWLDKTGIENGDLCHYIKDNDFTLITNDKDFLQLWSQYTFSMSIFPLLRDSHVTFFCQASYLFTSLVSLLGLLYQSVSKKTTQSIFS